MRFHGCLIVALGAIAASAPTARAQQEAVRRPQTEVTAPRVAPKPNPMKVTLVRSAEAGCEPDCAEWIAAQGQIDETTPEEFRRALARIGARKLPILIDSVGGEVDAALTIGRMIRTRGLDVFVTKTVLEPCAAAPSECRVLAQRGVQTGRPQAQISKCASACAFVLAGGLRRYVGPWTLVGLHEIKAVSTLRLVRQYYRLEQRSDTLSPGPPQKRIIKEELLKVETREGPAAERTYQKVGRYFADMGIAPAIMPIMRVAPNSAIHWMKIAELKSTGLATDFVNAEQVLAAKPAAAEIAGTAAGSVAAPAGPAPATILKPPTAAASRTAAIQPQARITASSGQGPVPRPAAARQGSSVPVKPKAEPNDPLAQFGN